MTHPSTQKNRWMRFNPEINTGNIIQIALIAVGILFAYGNLKERQSVQAQELQEISKKLESLVTKVDEVGRNTQALTVDVAVLRGRAAELSGSAIKTVR